MGKRFISLLLVSAIFLTTPGILAQAREIPKDPVHHCTRKNDGTDTTDWSYVYFGSYPQTEVMGSKLTAAITGASYDSHGDAWVDGVRYRRISKADTAYNDAGGLFGGREYRYFKYERIRWRVLQNDGHTLFVMADIGLDSQPYNETHDSVTWETCTLRNWLNNEFYNTAFSASEQKAIVAQTVVNAGNPNYDDVEGGNDTVDNVFLLSMEEVAYSEYGFCGIHSTWSVSRGVLVSNYAYVMGAGSWQTSDSIFNGNVRWLLRSPGSDDTRVMSVGSVGTYDRKDGMDVHTTANHACVPALHIDLSSDLWSTTENGDSTEGEGGGSVEPSVPPETDPTNSDTGNSSSAVAGTIQTITVSNITKTYGAKPFSLGAKSSSGTKLAYSVSNKKVATVDKNGKVTIKGCGITDITITAPKTDVYSQAQATIRLTVKPKKAAVSSVKSTKKKTATVKWKQDKKASGYIIQYAMDSKFKKNKVQMTVNKNKTVSATAKKLKSGKKYYVRVCAYAKSGKAKVQGDWSKVKTVKVK